MEPRYFAGEVVFVHPRLPVRRNDFVIVQIDGGAGAPPHGFVKQFISKSSTILRARQFNPDTVVEFPADRLLSVHRIVGTTLASA